MGINKLKIVSEGFRNYPIVPSSTSPGNWGDS